MLGEHFLLALLFLEDAELFEPLSGLCGLVKFSFSLTRLPVLVQNRQEVFRQESRRVECLIHVGRREGVGLLLLDRLAIGLHERLS